MMRSMAFIGFVSLAALTIGSVLDPRGYEVRILCLILLSAAMGQAWNILGGLANQISLGHAAFFGVGAYASTLLLIHLGLSPWLGMMAGIGIACLLAGLLALPTMRLQGPYFALATLAFAEAMRVAFNGASGLTGGPQGLTVPFIGDSLAMMQFRAVGNFLPIMVGLFALVSLVFAALSSGRLGYLIRAVREREDAAEVAGVDTFRIKLLTVVLSAGCAAACGTIYAQFNFFIDPDTVFSGPGVSIRMTLIAIVGGIGTLAGPVVGALLVVLLEEVLNATLSNRLAGISPLVYGTVLIAVVLLRPRGLVSLLPEKLKKVWA